MISPRLSTLTGPTHLTDSKLVHFLFKTNLFSRGKCASSLKTYEWPAVVKLVIPGRHKSDVIPLAMHSRLPISMLTMIIV